MLQLLRECQRGMRWRSRWQYQRPVTLSRELRGELARGLAVETHRFQQGAERAQVGEVVGGGLADGRIEAACALAGAQHVPQAEAVREQARQAFGVGQRGQRLARQRRQDGPQLVDALVNLTPSLQLRTARRRNALASNWRMMSDA